MNKKVIKKLMFIFAMVVLCMMMTLTANAEYYTGECGSDGDNVIWELDTETGVLTISGDGEMMSNYSSSGMPWYKENLNLEIESVIIEEGITSTSFCAFAHCYNIKNVYIPTSMIQIGLNTFFECDSISSIIVDELNMYYCSENGVLFDKEKTKLIKYPAGTQREEYVIPDTVEIIVDSAFKSCENLIKVVFPENLKIIEDRAFAKCVNVTEVEFDGNLKTIGFEAFYWCTNLKSVYISDAVEEIEKDAFYMCEKLEEITVSDINEFYSSENGVLFNKDKTQLILYPRGNSRDNYIVPKSVTEIIRKAFYCCDLKSMVIYDDVISIGEEAIFLMKQLEHIGYIGTEEQWNSIGVDKTNTSISNENLHLNFNPENDVKEEIIDSTCISEGTKTIVCSCGYTYSTETIATVDCLFKSYRSNNDATCIADGTKTAFCEYGCSNSNMVTDDGSALGHNMGTFVVVKEATCTVKGEERAECSRCDYYETREFAANNHKDENFDGYCDSCNEFIADKNCLCVCHAKTIGALVYKIFKFIDRIFKTNLLGKVFGISRICKCGIAHY